MERGDREGERVGEVSEVGGREGGQCTKYGLKYARPFGRPNAVLVGQFSILLGQIF